MSDGSQYHEATRILGYFQGRIGRFLDIGAFDGMSFSNTWPLSQLGWSGICVEPSPPAFCYLMKNYAGNLLVELVNAAIVGTEIMCGLRKFHCNTVDSISADMMSTFKPELRNDWQKHGHPFRDIWVPTLTWDELLVTHPGPFDFVNIDVEGTNAEVLREMPLMPAIQMICVENDPPEQISDLVKRRFPHVEVIGGNVLGWR